MTIENILLLLSGLLTGLTAGLMYAFNVAFVPGLRQIDPVSHIAAMQALNDKIKNPAFFLSFIGAGIVLPITAFLHRETPEFGLLVAASVLHIAGVIGVTAIGNLPLNDKLDETDINTVSADDAVTIRLWYQKSWSGWMLWHHVRTGAAILAMMLIFIVCLAQ